MSSSRLLRETVKRSKPLQPARQAGQPCVKRAVFAGDFHCLTTGLHSNLCTWPSFDLQFHPLSQPGSLTLSSHTYFFVSLFHFNYTGPRRNVLKSHKPTLAFLHFHGKINDPATSRRSCLHLKYRIILFVTCLHTCFHCCCLRGSRELGNLAFTYVHTLY